MYVGSQVEAEFILQGWSVVAPRPPEIWAQLTGLLPLPTHSLTPYRVLPASCPPAAPSAFLSHQQVLNATILKEQLTSPPLLSPIVLKNVALRL